MTALVPKLSAHYVDGHDRLFRVRLAGGLRATAMLLGPATAAVSRARRPADADPPRARGGQERERRARRLGAAAVRGRADPVRRLPAALAGVLRAPGQPHDGAVEHRGRERDGGARLRAVPDHRRARAWRSPTRSASWSARSCWPTLLTVRVGSLETRRTRHRVRQGRRRLDRSPPTRCWPCSRSGRRSSARATCGRCSSSCSARLAGLGAFVFVARRLGVRGPRAARRACCPDADDAPTRSSPSTRRWSPGALLRRRRGRGAFPWSRARAAPDPSRPRRGVAGAGGAGARDGQPGGHARLPLRVGGRGRPPPRAARSTSTGSTAQLRVDEEDMRGRPRECDAALPDLELRLPHARAAGGRAGDRGRRARAVLAGPGGPARWARAATRRCSARASRWACPTAARCSCATGRPRIVERRPPAPGRCCAPRPRWPPRARPCRAVGPLRRAASRAIGRASVGDAAAREGELTEVVIGEWGLSAEDMENAAGRPARADLGARARAPTRERMRARRRAQLRPAGRRAGGAGAGAVPRRCPAGTAPLYFPALARRPRRARSPRCSTGACARSRSGPSPTRCSTASRFAELEPLRGGLLALPVHQALSERHMERVLEAARAVLL